MFGLLFVSLFFSEDLSYFSSNLMLYRSQPQQTLRICNTDHFSNFDTWTVAQTIVAVDRLRFKYNTAMILNKAIGAKERAILDLVTIYFNFDLDPEVNLYRIYWDELTDLYKKCR